MHRDASAGDQGALVTASGVVRAMALRADLRVMNRNSSAWHRRAFAVRCRVHEARVVALPFQPCAPFLHRRKRVTRTRRRNYVASRPTRRFPLPRSRKYSSSASDEWLLKSTGLYRGAEGDSLARVVVMGRTDARLLSVLLILFIWRIAGAADASLIRFDIAAGDAQRTLLQFVAQANIEMLYSSDDVRGVVTNAVSGDFTVPEALRLMIEGTGLEVSFERDFTFASIRPSKRVGRRGHEL
jgi:hypothetical protein